MSRAPRASAEESRSRAVQREAEFFKERKRVQDANQAKTMRLKALRLAKEAVDREAAAVAAAEKAARPKKVRGAGLKAAKPKTGSSAAG